MSFKALMDVKTVFVTRPTSSPVIPDRYRVCNTSTIDFDNISAFFQRNYDIICCWWYTIIVTNILIFKLVLRKR